MKKSLRQDRTTERNPNRFLSVQPRLFFFSLCNHFFNPNVVVFLLFSAAAAAQPQPMSPEWKKRRIIIRKRRRKRGVDRSIPFLREEIRRAANLKSKKSCCGFVPINILRLLGADATKHRNQSTFDTAQLSFVPLLAQLKVPIDNIAPVVCFLLSYVFFFFLPLFALDHRWGGGIESRVSL